jgi:ketosteroid isomerase-like protein
VAGTVSSVATPTADEHTVRALFAAFAERDVEAALEHAHPDLHFWAQPTADVLDREEPYRGHDGFRAYMDDVERAWETFTVEPTDFRVAAGGVICFGEAEGRPRGSDAVRRVPVIWVFRLRDGLVVFCRVARTAAEATELVAVPAAREEADGRD